MSESALIPIWPSGSKDQSILVGAPSNFDLISALREATSIRLAMAFGHMTGWAEVGPHIEASGAGIVRILLGQAFFQTEPELLLRMMALKREFTDREFEAKLASAKHTFHPKVWIIDGKASSFSIVGSANLSRGGLLGNIECGVFTNEVSAVNSLRQWFDKRWNGTPSLGGTIDNYRSKYDRIQLERKSIQAKISAATAALIDEESVWRKSRAVSLAVDYWQTEAGKKEVGDRDIAISQMRNMLNYPVFDFTSQQFSQFLRVPLLGQIRLGPNETKMLSALERIRAILRATNKEPDAAMKALDDLQELGGIGRNVATKLLSVSDPTRFVVVNGPVENALKAFGFTLDSKDGISGSEYARFLREVRRFVEESESAGLLAASALDAFFYKYKDLEQLSGSD